MSLELPEAWINSAFRIPAAARDAMNVFEKASADGVDATLVVAPALTHHGKCYLAHWTGQELAVVELSPEQQRAFEIKTGTLFQDLERRHEPLELPPLRRVSLKDVQIDGGIRHDVRKPLRGTFAYETQNASDSIVLQCALRVKYFRPWLPSRITGYSYVSLVGRDGEVTFSFEPLDPARLPESFRGPLVLFLQLVTVRKWTMTDIWQRISNMLVRVIETR